MHTCKQRLAQLSRRMSENQHISWLSRYAVIQERGDGDVVAGGVIRLERGDDAFPTLEEEGHAEDSLRLTEQENPNRLDLGGSQT